MTLGVCGESIEEVELTVFHSIGIVEGWMSSRKLELAHHKTEAIVANNHKSEQQATFSAGLKAVLEVLGSHDQRLADCW